jgi:AcrR family transcriptional regulator
MENNSLETNWFKSRKDVLKSYAEQRRDRMGDAIGDYLTDEDVDARQAYEEILAEIQTWIDYHQKFFVKAQNLYALMQGERPLPGAK